MRKLPFPGFLLRAHSAGWARPKQKAGKSNLTQMAGTQSPESSLPTFQG